MHDRVCLRGYFCTRFPVFRSAVGGADLRVSQHCRGWSAGDRMISSEGTSIAKAFSMKDLIIATAAVAALVHLSSCDANKRSAGARQPSSETDRPKRPGLPQVPPDKAGTPPAMPGGTRSDYQPSTGQGGQQETSPAETPSGTNPAPENPNKSPADQR